MTKKLAILVLLSLCVVSFSWHHENDKAINTFKVEQIGVRM